MFKNSCEVSVENRKFCFATNLPKDGLWGRNFENQTPDSVHKQHFQDTICRNVKAKRTILTFLGLNLPKNEY